MGKMFGDYIVSAERRVVPPRKRMKHGIPCHVVKVTKQARIVCEIKGEKIYVLHCFGSHKGYERWYRSYK